MGREGGEDFTVVEKIARQGRRKEDKFDLKQTETKASKTRHWIDQH